jgi:hypothetical protein
MRYLPAVLLLAACASDPAPATDAGPAEVDAGQPIDSGIDVPVAVDAGPCGGACGPGTVCEGGRCVVPDAGAVDAGPPDAGAVDTGPEDAGPEDTGAVDAGSDVPAEAGVACPMGLGDCDGNAANGCEVDLRNNPDHCGGCGMACLRAPNIMRACRSMRCDALRCSTGFADCNNDPADGCEVNTQSSINNCGACGRVCPRDGGVVGICMGGSCR